MVCPRERWREKGSDSNLYPSLGHCSGKSRREIFLLFSVTQQESALFSLSLASSLQFSLGSCIHFSSSCSYSTSTRIFSRFLNNCTRHRLSRPTKAYGFLPFHSCPPSPFLCLPSRSYDRVPFSLNGRQCARAAKQCWVFQSVLCPPCCREDLSQISKGNISEKAQTPPRRREND